MRATVTCLLAVALLGFAVLAQAQTDARIGTWKMNVAKSKYDPGPMPKSVTRTYAPYGTGGVAMHEERVNADGTRTTLEYSMMTPPNRR